MMTPAGGWRELSVTAKDGTVVVSSWANLRLTDDTQVGVGIDIRERKRAEAAIQAVNQRLLDADHRKNQFMAMLSHELRNPLAPIRNSVHILERAAPGTELAIRAQQVIARGQAVLHRQRVDLNGLALDTADDHREVFRAGGVELVVSEAGHPLIVDGDPTRLAQVIGNLLHNAAKFTPRGGRVTLTVEEQDGGQARLSISDTGRGMSAQTLAQVFEPFVQADVSFDRARGGLGLGLALTRGLVEMHGGRVQADSAGLGQGARFTVTLPLAPGGAPGLETRVAAGAGRPGRRVLIIEDHEDAADTLRHVLRMDGHEVAVAHTGPDGLSLAEHFNPDVVLCDLGLPCMDGYEVAGAMRKLPSLANVCLIALSGYAQSEDVQKAIKAGFDRHMSKPPALEMLRQILASTP